MKKYLFAFYLTTSAILSRSQDFVGVDAQFYLNTTVKPIELNENLQKYHYKNFYLQFDSLTKMLTKATNGRKKAIFKPFQIGEDYFPISEYSKLVGMEFKVVGVYEGVSMHEFDKGKKFVLALKNETLGVIYYEYDTRYRHNFELTVLNGLKLPDGYWCKKFIEEKDKFEDKISYYSPRENGFSLVKVISNNIAKYYLRAEVGGSTVNADSKGLYLLFNDGTKLKKENAKIDVTVGYKGSFIYSAFIELTPEDLELLKVKKITDYRLYIYDGQVDSESAKFIQEYFKCITSI